MSERTRLDEQIDEAIEELIQDDIEGFSLVTSDGENYTHTWFGPRVSVPGDSIRHPYTLLLAAAFDSFSNISDGDAEDLFIAVMQATVERFDSTAFDLHHYEPLEGDDV